MSQQAQDPLAALRWLLEAGNDEPVLEQTVNRFKVAPKAAAPTKNHLPKADTSPEIQVAENPPIQRDSGTARRSGPSQLARTEDDLERAFELAERCLSLDELRRTLESFEGSQLRRNASKTVFADGNPNSGILFIGEAPGREEDRVGRPFVGRAGRLLDLMMSAIGLDRRSAYITNVLPWRPPDNRSPEATEVAQCIPFLRRHIELVSPEIMILLGSVPLRHVLGLSEGIMKCRGRWADYRIGSKTIPVMPTLHPAYLLRQPSHKRLAWRDFQEIDDRINFLQSCKVESTFP